MRLPAPARIPRVLWTLTALIILAGWADLARGGRTAAPIFLALGYLLLLPLAILAT